jgi:nucleoside-diphosphate-sugar epimerase
MKVLVTGNQGYIGSVLVHELLDQGFEPVGLDVGYYKECLLYSDEPKIKQIVKDIRDIDKNDLNDVEAIIHLAALSNDPLGELSPGLTELINLNATINLAKLAKSLGVKRFIYSSSQSMYGVSISNQELDEEGPKNPITAYAKTKWEAELALNKLGDNNFCVVSFRPSTVFGASPRLRCDIVFNNLVACAYTTGRIEIKSDGSPRRPVIHIKDVCSAFIAGLKAPTKMINCRSFNVGIPSGNYTIKQLAEAAQKVVPGSSLTFTGEHGADSRTYSVCFDRILTELHEYYKPAWNLEKGGIELVKIFDNISFGENDFRGEKTTRLIKLFELKKLGLLDSNLRMLNK